MSSRMAVIDAITGVVLNIIMASPNDRPPDGTVMVEIAGAHEPDGNAQFDQAGPGWTYDKQTKKFTPPKPYPSWVRSGNRWVAPKATPAVPLGSRLSWDEAAKNWVVSTPPGDVKADR